MQFFIVSLSIFTFLLQFHLIYSKECAAGTYKTSTGQCEQCKPGTFQPYKGVAFDTNGLFVTACFECPVGTFSNAGAAQCTPCPKGTTSRARSSSCFRCEKGYKVNDYTPISPRQPGNCIQCINGYTDAPNLFQCLPCPVSHIAPAGATSIDQCKPCPRGSHPSGTSCKKCPKNSPHETLVNLIRCPSCQKGTVFNSETNTCENCPPGQYGTNRVYPPNFLATCKVCPNGSNTFTAGKTICRQQGAPCPPDTFETSNGDCLTCNIYQRFDPKLKKCVPCPQPTLFGGGLNTTCTTGQNSFRFQGPENCAPGSVIYNESGQDSFSCRSCTVNSFTDKKNADRCIKCPIDSIRPTNANTCIKCPKGQVRRIITVFESEIAECVNPLTNCPEGSVYVAEDYRGSCKPIK